MTVIKRIFRFYSEGFRGMTVGKTLWIIIILKLIVFFIVLKLLFFPDFLNSRFNSDKKKSEYVLENLTNIKN